MGKLKDPTDGKFDVSGLLLAQSGGFLPMPIIVTEPALGGFGLGIAVGYFHGRKTAKKVDPWKLKMEELKPPSISLAAGLYTLNHSGVAVIGHLGRWRDVSIRYTGILGVRA